ncbi:UNVERIFIED_CONTAM: hypothetical protein GTU68_034559 [Idotea baltica]|nr:hypothetical protein [Idotea baltica]
MAQDHVRQGYREKMHLEPNFQLLLVNLKCQQLWWEWIRNKHMSAIKLKKKKEYYTQKTQLLTESSPTGRILAKCGITPFTMS